MAAQNGSGPIHPAPPDEALGSLLALTGARVLSLPAGGSYTDCGGDGDYWFIGSARGSLTVDSHSQYTILDPGQALVLYQCGAFTVDSVDGGQYMLVKLVGELPGRLLGPKMEGGRAFFPKSGPAVQKAAMALRVLEEEYPPIGACTASGLAYSMLMEFYNAPVARAGEETGSRLSPLVEAAVGIIQEEFPFLEGVDELAQRLEVSKAHLIRTFSRKVGLSPGKYITRTRVEYAKLLLQGGEASITYVAEASGFANANYFAKVFHRETGMSPSEYLQSAQGQGTDLGIRARIRMGQID